MDNLKTLLIIDDEETNINILMDLLEDKYDILASLDGEGGLEIVNEEKVDLILLDIMMPNIDGFEVCHRLKNTLNSKDIPVIFITAKTDEVSIEKAYEVGGIDYITKPFKGREVLSRINTHISLYEQRVELEKSLKESLEKSKIIKEQARFSQMRGLLKMISHQWRQPLNVIAVLIQEIDSLVEETDEELSKELNETIDTINKTIYELSGTLNKFSQMFHPDETLKEVCINNLVDEAISLISFTLKDLNIELEINYSTDSKIKIYKNALQEVILKIVQNSIEAFEKNPISNAKISITIQKETNTQIIIEDNAGGIDEKNLNKIFDPYFSTKEELQKFGLGLYGAKIIIESYFKGNLVVNNNNNGVTNIIHFPSSIEDK